LIRRGHEVLQDWGSTVRLCPRHAQNKHLARGVESEIALDRP
jgi:hypothetical protein